MINTVRLASNMQQDSIVDGEGIRSVIWFQGCSHNCYMCHNPETHDFAGGFEIPIDELKKQIKELEFQNGVTFSGGDPMFQPEALYELSKCCHECNLKVWCYTGFTFEKMLPLIIFWEDGRKFEIDKKSFNVKFRGSTNQRIVDVKKSNLEGKVVLVPKYIYEEQ